MSKINFAEEPKITVTFMFLNYYEIVGNTDQIEGRGQSTIEGVVVGSLAFREKKAEGHGPMGSHGYLRKASGPVVVLPDGTMYTLGYEVLQEPRSLAADTLEAKRQAILAKLTNEDLTVLGLKR